MATLISHINAVARNVVEISWFIITIAQRRISSVRHRLHLRCSSADYRLGSFSCGNHYALGIDEIQHRCYGYLCFVSQATVDIVIRRKLRFPHCSSFNLSSRATCSDFVPHYVWFWRTFKSFADFVVLRFPSIKIARNWPFIAIFIVRDETCKNRLPDASVTHTILLLCHPLPLNSELFATLISSLLDAHERRAELKSPFVDCEIRALFCLPVDNWATNE